MGRGPKRPRSLASLGSLALAGLCLTIVLAATAMDGAAATAATTGAPYTFTFQGNPTSPQPWTPTSWDVVVNSRDTKTFAQLEGMQAQHGANCGAYPATHYNDTYEGAVFLCHDHVMTAINAHGYGEIVLTPDHMVDFSGGDATITFKVSTLRTSFRDWIDLWITPFQDNLVLPLDEKVDLQGPPVHAIHVRMDQTTGTFFRAELIDNFQVTKLPYNGKKTLEALVGAPSAITRTTFSLTVSSSHLKFGAPDFGYYWVDTPIKVGWTRGIVQLSHHSYNPTKRCTPSPAYACLPNTWHWSNFSISNAVPFTMLRGDLSAIHAGTPATVTFPEPAPKNAFVRFAAIGTIDYSLDGGKTWHAARRQAQNRNVAEHFANYWMAVPEGTKALTLRGRNWFAGPWWVRDVAIWSEKAPTSVGPGVAPGKPSTARPAAISNQGILVALRGALPLIGGIALPVAAVLIVIGTLLIRRRIARGRHK